jgi:hypothetical protein
LFVLCCVVRRGREKKRQKRERERKRERRELRASVQVPNLCTKLLPFLGLSSCDHLVLLGSCFLRVFVWVPLLRTCSSFFRLRLWLFLASSGVIFGSFGNPFFPSLPLTPFLPPTRVPASCSPHPPLQRRKAFRQGRNMHVAVRGCT